MPFTPFHFGPGLLGKSLLPRHFSWLAFVTTQVVIDCETLWFLVRQTYPVHRFFHTLVGATLAGIVTGLVLIRLTRRMEPRSLVPAGFEHHVRPSLTSEISAVGVMAGALLGGLSHPLLDGIMHPDVRPLAPWLDTNPLLRLVGLATLHLACIARGVIGLLVIAVRVRRERA